MKHLPPRDSGAPALRPIVLAWNQMNGVASASAITAALWTLLYPLSAETSRTVKLCEVVDSISDSSLVSAAFLPRISMAVTTLALTPHMMWHLTHSCSFRSFPYL